MEEYKENNILFCIKYDSIYKLLSLSFRLALFIVAVLIFFKTSQIFFIVLSVLLIIYSGFGFLDILLFKQLIIQKNQVIKEWYIYKVKISIDDLIVNNSSSLFAGVLHFRSKKNSLLSILFRIHLLPVENQSKKIKELKSILVLLNTIKGDEYEWNC